MNSERVTQLHRSATDLCAKFERSGQINDLDRGILLYRACLALLPPGHPIRPEFLSDLANELNTRYEQSSDSGRPADLEEAIALYREVLELRPTSCPDRDNTLNNLAVTLRIRYRRSSRRGDLEEVILLHREALKLRPAPHSDRYSSLVNLSEALTTQYYLVDRREYIDEAISLLQEALESLPVSHPHRFINLNNLADALLKRFQRTSQCKDLDDAIKLLREAIEAISSAHPHRTGAMSNLADALQTRSQETDRHEDLGEAILLRQDVLKLRPVLHPRRAAALNGLARALHARFARSGQVEDLDNAISLNRDALELLPTRSPSRSAFFNDLALVLKARSVRSGRREDLDDAISLYRSVLELQLAHNPHRGAALLNLANALLERCRKSGRRGDLDEAILLQRRAIKVLAAPHPQRAGALTNLSSSLETRFRQSGRREDLDEAILLLREALTLLPAPHVHRPSPLRNLASALHARFGLSKRVEDLDSAVSLLQEALELLPAPHPDRPTTLGQLGEVLEVRFRESDQREDLDKAINSYQQSLDILVGGHPAICGISALLGEALFTLYSNTRKSEDLHRAAAAFRAAIACETASTLTRFRAAKSWVDRVDHNDELALEAYQAAIGLLPRLAMINLDLKTRQQALLSSDGLARGAAACAIRLCQYDKAIELLEEGRAVFWAQALQLRAPMSKLKHEAPELEMELRSISLELEQGSFRDIPRNFSDTAREVMSLEQEASYFHNLSDKWVEKLEEVRKRGFQDFLRLSRLATLQAAAVDGPVIFLNPGEVDSDALIMTLTGVQHVRLADLGLKRIRKLIKLLHFATMPGARYTLDPDSDHSHAESLVYQTLVLPTPDASGSSGDVIRHMKKVLLQTKSQRIFQHVLTVLWTSVAEPIIHALKLGKTDTLPNIWWCPVGPFAFLPIHAAGLYDGEITKSVSDYVVSSYTPTVSALLTPAALPSTDSFEMMAVVQPQALRYTAQELQKIETHVPQECLVKLGVPGAPASVEKVVSHLSTVSIAHFACHGRQNPQSPLDSALVLEDGRLLKMSRIMQQSMPNALLAFLCACETALGDENVPDEVIHLGATLLFAGFRGVIATMWSIYDSDGPKVADAFYGKLFHKTDLKTTPYPDTRQAARALHLAVAKLRSENVPFARWVPFIHLGR